MMIKIYILGFVERGESFFQRRMTDVNINSVWDEVHMDFSI